MLKKRVFSVFLSLLFVIVSINVLFLLPVKSADFVDTIGEWNFAGMGSITYNPNPVGNKKSNESVIIGANQWWYESIAGITAGETDGIYTFTGSKSVGYVSVFNMAFKLNKDIKKGVAHTFCSDLSGKNWPVNFRLYYSPTPSVDIVPSNADAIPSNAIQLYLKSGGASHGSLNSIEFTSESDLPAGGYICFKYKTDTTTDNVQKISKVKLTSYSPDSSALIKNGSFENGSFSWDLGGGNTINTSAASNGEKSVSLKKWYKLSQTVEVEKLSSYQLSFDLYNIGKSWGFAKVYASDNSLIKQLQMNPYGHTGWETVSYDFETKNTQSIKIEIIADADGMIVDNFVLEKLNIDNAIVKNGSFENGTALWDFSSNQLITATASDGINCVLLKKWYHLSQNFTVDPNKSYRICFDVFNTTGTYGFMRIYDSDDLIMKEFQIQPYGLNGWETATTVFESGENENLRLDFVADGENIRLDNVIVIETDPNNLIVNGDFELKKLGWKFDDSFIAISDFGKEGNGISVKGGYHKALSQNIVVEENTNYKLSFDYKGITPQGIAAFAISKNETFNSYSVLAKGSLESSEVWNKSELVFSSGSNTALKLLFQTSYESDYLIDNVIIEKTTEASTIYEDNRAVFVGSIGENYWHHYVFVPKEGSNLILNEDFSGTSSDKINNATYFQGVAGSITDEDGASYFGDKALKFQAGETEEIVSIPLKLEKDKTYYIGMYSKVGKFDPQKGTSFTYGISDPDSGNFLRPADLSSNNANMYTDTIQLIAQHDSSWHYNLFKIETNGQERVDFTLRGKEITAYIDTLYVFDPDNSEHFQGTLNKISNVTITDKNATELGTKSDEQNLFENFDLSQTDTYWSDKTKLNNWVFGDTLTIANSNHNIQKSALLYDNYRRYPRNIYYIKWVDVKPNTQYTFSARYVITKPGDGYFGIIEGYNSGSSISSVSENVIHPNLVEKYEFNEASYDVDQNWQDVGFSFNTGDRNRVGFFVQDGGGTAYIDDLRLFETKNGTVLKKQEDNFPNELISNDSNLMVTGNDIYGISQETKLSNVIKKFENAKYIRVFDAYGDEVTDYNILASTGMEIRLMNGPVIKARATIVILGDANGDGIVNKEDSKAIIKSLGKEKPLDGAYLAAADYDQDGEVTAFDSLLGSKSVTRKNCNFILSGPDVFSVGDEIEISLVSKVNNVFAVNGTLNFERDVLNFKSATIKMDGNWVLSYAKSATEVVFAATDIDKQNPITNGKVVITFTFVVGDIEKYSDIKLALSHMFAASETTLYTSNEYVWPDVENDSIDINADSEDVELLALGNRLSLLKIDEADIVPEFDPEIKQYTATVPYKIEKVTVTAIPADENATVKIGDTNLEFIGKNAVDVEVYSVEGQKRTYRIIVTREAPNTIGNSSMSVWVLFAIISGVVLLIVAGTILTIILLRKKSKKQV